MGKCFVYMVQCADGIYFTGITDNVEARVKNTRQEEVPDATRADAVL